MPVTNCHATDMRKIVLCDSLLRKMDNAFRFAVPDWARRLDFCPREIVKRLYDSFVPLEEIDRSIVANSKRYLTAER